MSDSPEPRNHLPSSASAIMAAPNNDLFNSDSPAGAPSTQLIVGISGASGAIYGVRLLELLGSQPAVRTHLVISQAGKLTIGIETSKTVADVEALADQVYGTRDIAASISSGSFDATAMIVAPCSMKTLSAIVNSYSDNLLTRAADVMLKERRPLILMPRESPLHVGHTRLLHQAAEMGIHLCPPMPAFYNEPQTLDDVINHSIGRALDLIGLDVGVVHRWAGRPVGQDGSIPSGLDS